MTARWDNHFLDLALAHARMSKDPNTQVGAVAVRDRIPVSFGYNGFPMGIADRPEVLADREAKLRLIVHAEQNVIALAARLGVRLWGCTLYVACTDSSGEVWGGPPCDERCMPLVIQAGFTEVVARPMKAVSKWRDSLTRSIAMMEEAGIAYREVPLPEVTDPKDVEIKRLRDALGEIGRSEHEPGDWMSTIALQTLYPQWGAKP